MMSLTEQDFSQSHPILFNILVLENLFKFVPLDDLLNMRCVCKLWWKLSLPVIRSSSQICIDGQKREDSNHKYEDYLALVSPTDNDDKFGFMQYPFEDFYFNWSNVGGDVLKFCTQIGSQIKRLTIVSSWLDHSDFRKLFFELLPNLESLVGDIHLEEFYKEGVVVGVSDCPAKPIKTMKSLDLSLKIRNRFGSFQLPVSWLEIFQYYPALTALSLHEIEESWNADSNTEFERVLLAMKTVSENTATQWKIKKLNIRRIGVHYENDYTSAPFTPVVLGYLRQLQFPLRSLSLDVFNSQEAVSDFLDIYSGALQELILYSDFSQSVFRNTSSSFDCLSKLHLIGQVPNLYFLKSTRNLKTLWIESGTNGSHLDTECIRKPFQSKGIKEYLRAPLCAEKFVCNSTLFTIQNTNFIELDGFVLQSLEELVFGYELCSSDDLWALVKLMPNLTRLGIGLDNDGFRLLCNNLKGLTALDIEPSRVDEYGITGTVLGVEDVHLPNITDLINLRFFGIGKALTLAGLLSEVAVKNGLLQLRNLNDMCVYCSRNVSTETFTQLCKKYPTSCIRRSNI